LGVDVKTDAYATFIIKAKKLLFGGPVKLTESVSRKDSVD